MIRDHLIVDSITVKHKKFVFNETKEVTKGKYFCVSFSRSSCFRLRVWSLFNLFMNFWFLKHAAPNYEAKYQSTSGQTLRSPPWWGREAAWPRRRPPWCSSAWTGPCPAASTHKPPPSPPHQPYPQKPASAPLVPGLLWIGMRWWGKRQKTIFPQSLDLTAPDTWIQIFI